MQNRFQTYKWLIVGFLIFSFLGFLDAAYLSVKHYLGTPVTCSIFEGCEKVTTSQYAVIAGVPLALWGAVFYLFMLILTVLYWDLRAAWALNLMIIFSVSGFLVSALLMYLQFFVIKALCLYCVVSAVDSTALFILGLIMLRLTYRSSTS